MTIDPDKLEVAIEWFIEWVEAQARKPSALEAEDYGKMFDVAEAARAHLASHNLLPGKEGCDDAEKLTEHADMWGRELRKRMETKISISDAEFMDEAFRQCIEEWIGETRQPAAPIEAGGE